MKKSVLFTIAAAMLTISTVNVASAQKGFYIGVQGQQQLSGMYNSDDADNAKFDYKASPSTAFGLNGGYNFNKHIGVSAEAMYSIEGQRYELNNVEFRKKISYVKVPLLFTYNTNPAAKVMFIAKAGPQIGLLTKANLKNGDGDVLVKDTKDSYETVTFGAAAGAGVRVNLAKHLFLDAGLKFDGNFTNSEVKTVNETNVARAKTYNMNGGIEAGIKYFFN
jgi:opacity protein-like surface antigen